MSDTHTQVSDDTVRHTQVCDDTHKSGMRHYVRHKLVSEDTLYQAHRSVITQVSEDTLYQTHTGQ